MSLHLTPAEARLFNSLTPAEVLALRAVGVHGHPLLTFIITGPPRTKKNHGRRIKRGKRTYTIPSEAYETWNESAQLQFAKIRAEASIRLPITENVNVRALFMRHADVGDAVGFYQAIADSMENAGILENDRQIVSWDGSRLLKDKDNPRIIVAVETAR